MLETPLAPHQAQQLARHAVVDIRLRRFLVGPLVGAYDEVAYVNSHGLYVVPPLLVCQRRVHDHILKATYTHIVTYSENGLKVVWK